MELKLIFNFNYQLFFLKKVFLKKVMYILFILIIFIFFVNFYTVRESFKPKPTLISNIKQTNNDIPIFVNPKNGSVRCAKIDIDGDIR